MRVLVTGDTGYVGQVMTKTLLARGHEVVGVDNDYFFPSDARFRYCHIRGDIREMRPSDFSNVSAVIHLAALSNDPLGNISEELTKKINHEAAIDLLYTANQAGVDKFLFSSSCSVYGDGRGGELLDEQSPTNPLTHYAKYKLLSETVMSHFGGRISPVFLRSGTMFGHSPNFRSDLIVNAMTCTAFTEGKIKVLGNKDLHRPLVHVQDVCNVFSGFLTARSDLVKNQVYNVGTNRMNFSVERVAKIVNKYFPDAKLEYIDTESADARSYWADFSKLEKELYPLPLFRPISYGVEEIATALMGLSKFGMVNKEAMFGSAYVRLKKITNLINFGEVDKELRWTQ